MRWTCSAGRKRFDPTRQRPPFHCFFICMDNSDPEVLKDPSGMTESECWKIALNGNKWFFKSILWRDFVLTQHVIPNPNEFLACRILVVLAVHEPMYMYAYMHVCICMFEYM